MSKESDIYTLPLSFYKQPLSLNRIRVHAFGKKVPVRYYVYEYNNMVWEKWDRRGKRVVQNKKKNFIFNYK